MVIIAITITITKNRAPLMCLTGCNIVRTGTGTTVLCFCLTQRSLLIFLVGWSTLLSHGWLVCIEGAATENIVCVLENGFCGVKEFFQYGVCLGKLMGQTRIIYLFFYKCYFTCLLYTRDLHTDAKQQYAGSLTKYFSLPVNKTLLMDFTSCKCGKEKPMCHSHTDYTSTICCNP